MTHHTAWSMPSQPKDDVNEIKKRLEHLESLLSQHSRYPGKEPQHTLPANSLGNIPDFPIRVQNRSKEDAEDIDPEAEDAALVLEGLTMDGAMSFGQHRGGQAMRRAFHDAQASDDLDAKKELANEGVIDPMDASLTAKHAAAIAQFHAMQEPNNMGEAPTECPLSSACNSTSLLRLTSSTESSLGWGMGWALAAAQEIGQFERMNAPPSCMANAAPVTPERMAVLSAIIRTLPSLEQIELLLDVFERRAQPFVLNVVHIPTLRKELRILYSLNSPLCRARGIDVADTCWLGVLLMVLVIGLRFRETHDTELTARLGEFVDPGYPPLWYSATKTCLVLSGFIGSSSLTVLTTILLLMFQCPRSANQAPSLMRIAISNAQGMGLHRLGDLSNQPKPGESAEYRLRREMAKRLWWALVVKDWNCALVSTTPYMIQPHQFNTPLPGNFNSEDLLQSSTEPHPRDAFTEMSFFLSGIELAKVTRENAEIINQLEMQQATDGKPRQVTCDQNIMLDSKYRAVLNNASIFSNNILGKQNEEVVSVQRWAFQQHVFDRMLQVHRAALSKKQARNCCVELARKVLSLQRAIRSRTDLGDKLVYNVLQSFNATTLLCLDLLYTPPTAVQRETIRAEITEGLEGMCRAAQDAGLTPRGIRIIHVLLDEEQKQWEESQLRGKEEQEPQSRMRLINMALRVARISRGNEPLVDDDSQNPDMGQDILRKQYQQKEEERKKQQQQQEAMLPNPLSAFPPLQPTLTSFDPYQMGPSGIEVPMSQDPPVGTDFNLQSFLDNFELPNAQTTPKFDAMNYENSSTLQTPSASGPSMLERPDSFQSDLSGSFSRLPPGSMDSDSQSTRSGSGSSQMIPSPQDERTPLMDNFWDWILSQGTRPDISSTTPFSAPVQSMQSYVPDPNIPNVDGDPLIKQSLEAFNSLQNKSSTATLPSL